jgi:hypothetical protein
MREVSRYRPNQDELVLRVNGASSVHPLAGLLEATAVAV